METLYDFIEFMTSKGFDVRFTPPPPMGSQRPLRMEVSRLIDDRLMRYSVEFTRHEGSEHAKVFFNQLKETIYKEFFK